MKTKREDLLNQVFVLCHNYLREDDVVVGVLRYGAHIPHIYQNICLANSIQPKRIHLLLSHMLPFFSQDFYKKNRFVLLDDTVYLGNELSKMRNVLLEKFDVPKDNISTATLVVHEDSPYNPDFPKPPLRLNNPEYIAWKETLGSLVAEDIRPTERDHPLYFFEMENFDLSNFLTTLQEYGVLHSVGTSNSQVLKVSLTIDASILEKLKDLGSVVLSSTYKIRFYLHQTAKNAKFTAVPMGFSTINIAEFLRSGHSSTLAKLVGLPSDYFERIYASYHKEFRDSATYYFASRCIAAILLELLLKEITPKLGNNGTTLSLLNPIIEDNFVDYQFPPDYDLFYSTISERVTNVLKDSRKQNPTLFGYWKKPSSVEAKVRFDPILPASYNILGFLVKDHDPAIWDGKRWLPNIQSREIGITYQDLLSEFKDPLFISRSLDYLLESGLLRAKDLAIDENRLTFTRFFLAGGEYNAVQVSRIADLLKYEPPNNFDPRIAEEEAIDLWGSY